MTQTKKSSAGANPFQKPWRPHSSASPKQSQPKASCTVDAAPQDFDDGHSLPTSQRLPQVGFGIGPTHVSLGRALVFCVGPKGSRGCLRAGAPASAPRPMLLNLTHYARRICPVKWASHPSRGGRARDQGSSQVATGVNAAWFHEIQGRGVEIS